MKKSNLTYIKYNYIFSVFARKSRSYIFTRRIPINIAFPINQTTILHFRCSLPENFHWFHYFIIFPLSGFSDGGAFSGKAGSFIGSNWRDINYIKGILRISNKPKTQKQLEQQAKFALAVRFLRPVKLQVEAGFSKIKQGHTTSYNLALKQILVNAITGTYPDY
ncbi:DUF6266 family protein, partial [Daejeonella sp.]|uniref:DUF6266 family protein n=1 Tax=Daejeonella sp. TaxID=2805397 RepID=UPI00398346C9